MIGPGSLAGEAAGLYLHIPFCSAICPYCDFSVLLGGPERRSRFVDHLLSEVALEEAGSWVFDTLYFGGGTPSALAMEDLLRIFQGLRQGFRWLPGAHVFFEANPEDVTFSTAEQWRRAGVDTLSLGVQSFDPGALSFLGRRHSPEEGLRGVEIVRQAGFSTVSLDLIYGLPGQSIEAWRRDLELAVEAGVDHLSCYQLTVHEGTAFGFRAARGELQEMGDDAQGELFRFTHSFLADHGYPGYEVSNFAVAPEHQSRHNRKYWDHTPYLGLGPSAHSYRSGRRWWNLRKLGPYEARLARGERPEEGGEALAPRDMALEALLLGLRTYAGVDLVELEERYGVAIQSANEGDIERLSRLGLLERSGSRLMPTLEGLAVADSLARSFEL